MPDLPRHLLLCPVCGEPLDRAARTLACDRGHRFDAARQGYFNLLTGKGSPFEGDTAQMVDAREQFLGSGHYAPLRRAVVAAALRQFPAPALALDAGAGTGYYLEGLADAVPGLFPVALDISKVALRRAARRLPGGVSVVWDVWRPLPLADGSVDVLLNVFAPRNPDEFVRVLAPGGCLVVVTPRPGHLAGLEAVGPLLSVPAQKADDVRAAFEGALVETWREDLDYAMQLPQDLARSALVMGPAAHHGKGGTATEESTGESADDLPDGSTHGSSGGSSALREAAALEIAARFTVQVLARTARPEPAEPRNGTEG
ncbi:putative RNA methyltransferase [Arthrobacter burdickii]|uniref:Methyltransferase domain-containing protein n=1 Tax=Arthrobacter burdickii TaxID=3035920 RepID=A0ABT8K2E2_9MICC|nr:methyltransferase domain-containing protein [Arthrobacter burdickii]MDN4611595.1 methyltransferase domain-containing protein [Arthrobacter burdickii]